MSKKPKKTKRMRDPAEQVVFLRGRHARKSGIRREDTPYLDREAEVWREGWDYEDKAQQA